MRQRHHEYEIDEDVSRVDIPRIHSWLTTSYWSPGISIDTVIRGVRGSSLVVGAYRDHEQVGILRVISDKATFAWVADVFVAENHRQRGLAKAMLRFALEHPEHQGLRRWVLATKDAHDVYATVGFIPLPYPERFMLFKPAGGATAGASPRP
jgi:GNAT superfamily N-acetyltransferase